MAHENTETGLTDAETATKLEGQFLSVDDLLKINIFQGAPKPLLEKNLGAVVLRRFQKGDVLCREGDQGSTAFYITKGSVKIVLQSTFARVKTEAASKSHFGFKNFFGKMKSYFSKPEKETQSTATHAPIPIDAPVDLPYDKPMAILKEGSLFGEMTCMSFYPRSATVIAEENCEVLEMLQNILQICQRNPEFKKKLDQDYRERALETHLRSVPLFEGMDADFLKRLKERVELVSFEPGSSIFSEGDTADALYLVRIGFVKVSKSFPGGTMVLGYLSRGSYFGEMALLSRHHDQRKSLRVPVQLAGTITTPSQEEKPVRITMMSNHGALIESEDQHVLGEGQHGVLNFAFPSGEASTTFRFSVVRTVEKSDEAKINAFALEFANVTEDQRKQIRSIYTTLLPPGIRTASCMALDHVEVVKIKSDDVHDMLERFPEVTQKIQAMVESRETTNKHLMSVPQGVSVDEFLDQGLIQAQNLLVLDLESCTRCDACTDACASTHDGITRLVREGLRYENFLVATSCRQCMDPMCMVGCPVGSIRRKDSLEIVIEDWCIGCGLCSKNCPYGNINMHSFETMAEDKHEPGVKKAVMKKKAVTCDLCTDLEEPSCVYACPHDAAHRIDPKEFFGL